MIRSEVWFRFNVAMKAGAPAAFPAAFPAGIAINQPSIIAARNVPVSIGRSLGPGRLLELRALDSSALRPPEIPFI